MLPQEFYVRLHHSRYFTHIMQYKNMQNIIKSTIHHRAVVVGDSVLIFFADGSPFISRQSPRRSRRAAAAVKIVAPPPPKI